MKLVLAAVLAHSLSSQLFAQTRDTSFVKRVTAASWMPDGEALLLNVMKIDKARKVRPVARKFLFIIARRQFNPLPLDGSGLTPAPDGHSIAYLKIVSNKTHIYLYDLRTQTETPMVSDTLRKFALSWSPDGKSLAYNIELGTGRDASIEICIYSIATSKVRQITQSRTYRSYNPVWNPKNNMIVYYFEKGDNRDQILLTDSEGSFRRNLTNDTTSHNYYPSWLDEKTILYTKSPDTIMTMRSDGSNKQRVEGIRSTQATYNRQSMRIAYTDEDGRVMLYDWKNKTTELLLDEARLSGVPFN